MSTSYSTVYTEQELRDMGLIVQSMSEADQEIKADKGKPKLHLVPWEIVNAIAEVREYGVRKYGDKESWKSVEAERYVDALLRHTIAFAKDPAGLDRESGLPHIAHVACNVAFLCEFYKEGKLC